MGVRRAETRYELGRDALADLLEDQPQYRVEQLWKGLYDEGLPIEEISTLPKGLRAEPVSYTHLTLPTILLV